MIGITGGNGVLGKILVHKYNQKNQKISVFAGDITIFDEVNSWLSENQITQIVHLASKVAVNDVKNNLPHAYDVNISGTINLIKAIECNTLKVYFFYASSSHVYKSSKFPLAETDIAEPINSYGLTKYVSEMVLNDYKKNKPEFGLCIGRIFSFFHESQNPPFLYPNLRQRFQNDDLKKPFHLFGALSTRDFLNAEEVCDIIMKLVAKKQVGTINIASGTSIRIKDFVEKLAPIKLNIIYDIDEKQNHLNANTGLLNKILEND